MSTSDSRRKVLFVGLPLPNYLTLPSNLFNNDRAVNNTKCKRKVESSSSDSPGCAPWGCKRRKKPSRNPVPCPVHSFKPGSKKGGSNCASQIQRWFPGGGTACPRCIA